jgi:hypothetical protein
VTLATLPMPLTPLALLLLGDDTSAVHDVARLALHGYVERTRAPHEDLLAAIDGCEGGPCLPFELDEDERLVAQALGLAARDSNGQGCAIFSRLSRVDAGALLVPVLGHITYLDDSAPELDRLAAWFYPGGRERYFSMVESLTETTQAARVSVGKRLSIEIPVTNATAAMLKRRPVTVSLIDDSAGGTAGDLLQGADVTVSGDDRSLRIEFSRPEAVLRLSAAAELGRWLRAESGSEFRAFLRLPPLSVPMCEVLAVVSASELNRQLLHADAMPAVDVPAELWSAARPGGQFRASSLTPVAVSYWLQRGLFPS